MVALSMLRGIWKYRGFILGTVRREFQIAYRNSLLGATWTILNPLAMIVVYTMIFSQVMQTRLAGNDSSFAYSIYLCAGVLTWGLFAEITSRGQNVFIEYANLIKKISFPRICLPLIVVLNASLNFAIIFGLFSIFLVMSGHFPGWIFLSIFPVLAVQIIFSIGLGIILGVLNVFFRDVGQLFSILLQFWFWLTPIVYPSSVLPEGVRSLLVWNPMYPLVSSYQSILIYSSPPRWKDLLPVLVLATMLCILAMYLFRRRAGEMVDEL